MNVLAPTPPYRPRTKIKRTPLNFIYNGGGIGDYIQWTPAIQWAIEHHPWLTGYVVTPPYFDASLISRWFAKYSPRYKVIMSQDFACDERLAGVTALAANREQYANANHMSLFDLGWIYYAQTDPKVIPKEWRQIPPIHGNEKSLKRFRLPERYAVLPVTATSANRRLPAGVIRDVAAYLKGREIVSVFLGKRDMAPDHMGTAAEGIDLSTGIDLREQTSLLEAACIMARAQVVLGIDGGLLHLAACSKVPVIMGFTSVYPRLRVPPRAEGTKTIVVTPPESLPCRFCNSRMRFVLGHDFGKCLWGDNACVDTLDAPSFIRAIETILTDPGHAA